MCVKGGKRKRGERKGASVESNRELQNQTLPINSAKNRAISFSANLLCRFEKLMRFIARAHAQN